MTEDKPIIRLRDLLGFIQNLDPDTVVVRSDEEMADELHKGGNFLNLNGTMNLLERDKRAERG